MDHLQPITNIDPKELPAGFTLSDPNRGGGGGGSDAAASGGGGDAAQQQQQQQHKQSVLEQALTMDARARLRRIQLVKPEKVQAVENIIYNMAMSRQLPGPITEDKLIEMLERQAAAKSNSTKATSESTPNPSSSVREVGTSSISIQRKKYAMDSDDDDDNDDDLL